MKARPLTAAGERLLVRSAKKLPPRNRALTIGHVLHEGRIRDRVALPPRLLKGGYGGSRTVPVGPELHCALERYLTIRAREDELQSDAPLFLSRQRDADGKAKGICRSTAEKIIKASLLAIAHDVAGLSTHSLRKAWASRLYKVSGYDILVMRDGLGHSSVAVSEKYLPDRQREVEEKILKANWSRRSRKKSLPIGSEKTAENSGIAESSEPCKNAPKQPAATGTTGTTGVLPGFEFAA